MVKFVLKYCIQKELLKLKDSKLTLKTFMEIRLVLSDRVTYIAHVAIQLLYNIIFSQYSH